MRSKKRNVKRLRCRETRSATISQAAMFPNFPRTSDKFTHEWLTHALNRSGLLGEHAVTQYPFESFLNDFRVALLRSWIGTVNGLGSSAASTWIGRQAQLAEQSVRKWNSLICAYRLRELLD
jgi:hypothetical protein